ncbi:MAG: peptide ABC transporter substrate-binding protein, partial [Oscillospiraceae bacterium]
MKLFRKTLALLLAAAMSVCVFTGCGDKTEGEKTSSGDATVSTGDTGDTSKEDSGNLELVKEDQVFIYSEMSDAVGLNPILNSTGPDNGAQTKMIEGLVVAVADENGAGVIKGSMAEKWDMNEDGTVYTFHIRDNAKWSDGVDFTADDFVYTLRLMADPVVACTNAWLFDGIIKDFGAALYSGMDDGEGGTNPVVAPDAIGVKAIDAKTVEITLEKPTPYFLELLAGAKPVRQDLYEKYGAEYGSSLDKVAMNGMFLLEQWDQKLQMTFVKNPTYWNAENVKLEKIVVKIIEDPATDAQSLLNGDIDLSGSKDPKWIQMFEDSGKFNKVPYIAFNPEWYIFNAANKYLKNTKVRQALSLSIDRERFVSELREGKAVPLYSLHTPVMGYDGQFFQDYIGGRNQFVKQMMDENPDPKALLIEGLKELGLDPDPSKVTITLVSRGTSEFSKKAGEWMKQEVESKLGINLEIDMIEWNIMWDRVKVGEYEIATAGFGPYYNDPYGLLCLFDPVNGYFNSSKTGWTGPDADK